MFEWTNQVEWMFEWMNGQGNIERNGFCVMFIRPPFLVYPIRDLGFNLMEAWSFDPLKHKGSCLGGIVECSNNADLVFLCQAFLCTTFQISLVYPTCSVLIHHNDRKLPGQLHLNQHDFSILLQLQWFLGTWFSISRRTARTQGISCRIESVRWSWSERSGLAILSHKAKLFF